MIMDLIAYERGLKKMFLLAHLSQRLRGELIVYQASWRLSIRPSIRLCVHTFKHEYLWDQWVDRNQILSEASLGWGIGCIRVLARSDQNSNFHGNISSNRVIMEETVSRLFLGCLSSDPFHTCR